MADDQLTTIYFVRHGPTAWDKLKPRLITGARDMQLLPEGELMIEEVAKQLKSSRIKPQAIISSSRQHVLQSAKILLKELGSSLVNKEIIVFPEFDARNWGRFTGMSTQETFKSYPQERARGCTRGFDDAPPEGETTRQVASRVYAGLNQLKSQFPDGEVIVCGHAFVGRVINGILNKCLYTKSIWDPEDEGVNDDFFKFFLEPGKFVVFKIGELPKMSF